ncbi:MAG: fibronectin type III domain-containing protein, partial [Pseudomonadota bacterium]
GNATAAATATGDEAANLLPVSSTASPDSSASPGSSAAPPVAQTPAANPASVSNFGTASLSWTPPTAHTDGSQISNLAGYNIYYGTSSATMTNKIQITNPGLTAYTVADLASGTYYFGITAYTAAGTESDISAVGSKTII